MKIITHDGVGLSATRFIPEQSSGRVILINSATGVRQHYYADFASFLARKGYDVYTYDYRGIGESRPASLRGYEASMYAWGAHDYAMMVRNILQTHPNARLTVIGHSVGGQIVGFSPVTEDVDAVVMIGSQTPYWRNYRGVFLKTRLWLFWHVVIPVFTRIAGYFPARTLRLFEDLPHGVATQWARWAKNANYAFDELPEEAHRFRSLRVPALMVSFTDDGFAPLAAVQDLMSRYDNLKWNHWHFEPADVRQRRVGHFGFFRKSAESTLWKGVMEWIENPAQMKESQAA